MTKQSLSRSAGLVAPSLRASPALNIAARLAPRRAAASSSSVPVFRALPRSSWLASPFPSASSRLLSTTSRRAKGILPDSDDPAPPNVEESTLKAVPAELTDETYHQLADDYLSIIQDRLEELAEKNDQVDVEYSAGVLNVTFPSIGTYVINKQPPNKQIWLSSPVSGPKRYDYVVYGEGQGQKEDTAVGDWVYLRDGSTMNDLFAEELDVDLALHLPQ